MTPEEIIGTITERVRDTANVKVVFGDPIEMSGVTVIPVATVKVAGGGGGGSGRPSRLPLEGDEQSQSGMGLGLQIMSKPLGYIEVVEGKAKLVPIVDVTKVAIVSMITTALAFVSLAKLLTKRFKMHKAKGYWGDKKYHHMPAE